MNIWNIRVQSICMQRMDYHFKIIFSIKLQRHLSLLFPSIEECGCQRQHVPARKLFRCRFFFTAPIVPPCIHSDLRRSSCWNSWVHFCTEIIILAKDKPVFELLPKHLDLD